MFPKSSRSRRFGSRKETRTIIKVKNAIQSWPLKRSVNLSFKRCKSEATARFHSVYKTFFTLCKGFYLFFLPFGNHWTSGDDQCDRKLFPALSFWFKVCEITIHHAIFCSQFFINSREEETILAFTRTWNSTSSCFVQTFAYLTSCLRSNLRSLSEALMKFSLFRS